MSESVPPPGAASSVTSPSPSRRSTSYNNERTLLPSVNKTTQESTIALSSSERKLRLQRLQAGAARGTSSTTSGIHTSEKAVSSPRAIPRPSAIHHVRLVVEIGHRWTRCVALTTPSSSFFQPTVLATPRQFAQAMKGCCYRSAGEVEELSTALSEFLWNHFVVRFATPSMTAYIVVNVDDDLAWRALIRDTLRHLCCATVFFLEHPASAVMMSGRRTGIVVDLGWDSTRVTAIFENVPHPNVLYGTEALPYGMKHVLQTFEACVREAASAASSDGEDFVIDEEVLQTAVLRSVRCAMNRAESMHPEFSLGSVYLPNRTLHNVNVMQAVEPLVDASALVLTLPTKMTENPGAAEETKGFTQQVPASSSACFRKRIDWTEKDTNCYVLRNGSDVDTIPQAIALALVRADVTRRRSLAENIVICGGGASIPGLLPRIAVELKTLLDQVSQMEPGLHPWSELCESLPKFLQFYTSPVSPSLYGTYGIVCALTKS